VSVHSIGIAGGGGRRQLPSILAAHQNPPTEAIVLFSHEEWTNFRPC